MNSISFAPREIVMKDILSFVVSLSRPQSRQSGELFLKSSELGTPPLPRLQTSVPPTPSIWFQWGACTLACGRGSGVSNVIVECQIHIEMHELFRQLELSFFFVSPPTLFLPFKQNCHKTGLKETRTRQEKQVFLLSLEFFPPSPSC
jgi:hypothetical protein